MKADINDQGQLVVTPESNAERIALKCWEETNKTMTLTGSFSNMGDDLKAGYSVNGEALVLELE